MTIQENIDLAPLTTFGTGGKARFFVNTKSSDDLLGALKFAKEKNIPQFVMGGGSNVVVADKGFNGLVIHITNTGISHIDDGDDALVTMAAGEVWDDVVAYAVKHGLWGIENLSHIPGNAGAFVVQNVGAYGQEASQVTESVKVFDTQDMTDKVLTKEQCGFSYRRSIFNSTEKGRYIVLATTLRLHTTPTPMLDYPDIQKYFAEQDNDPSIADIRQAIITIRDGKFPDWQNAGTAGSFFKNLYVSDQEYTTIKSYVEQHTPELLEALEGIKSKFYSEDGIKIPTAFIIDKVCGLKGRKVGGAVVSESQALAILNPNKTATSDDVVGLIEAVRSCVKEVTGKDIEVEPELLGF
ncbi:MAG: UDP-N-acetylmuramate dehydrogenase [Patescibacteria group bacterium]